MLLGHKQLKEGVNSVSSPVLGKKQTSLGEKQHRLGSPTAPYVRLNVRARGSRHLHASMPCSRPSCGRFRAHVVLQMEFKPSSPVQLGSTRDPTPSQRLRSHRTQAPAWWGSCPPPDILRRLSRFAIGYALCVTISLMLINWALHRLPSTEQLASEVQQDPANMVLRIPRYVPVPVSHKLEV